MTYEWLKKIPGSLLEQDEMPLLGTFPPFPLQKFIGELSKDLQNNTIKITTSEPQWRTETELLSGIGTPNKVLSMVIAGQDGKLHWTMAEEELSRLMETLLMPGKVEPDYLEGFHHFIALEAINAVRNAGFDPRLSIQLLRETETPKGNLLTVDVSISLNETAFNGRLFLDNDLRRSIKKFYAKEAQNDVFKSPLAEKLNVYVGIEVGKIALTTTELTQVKKGDFVILDSCSLTPGDTKGRVTLTYQGRPLFLAKLQEGSIKLSERPLYNEVTMGSDDHTEDEEYEEDEESELEEDDEEEEYDDDEEEETIEEEDTHEEVSQSDVAVVPEAKKKVAKSPDEIPLNVVVEIARIQMPLKTLMNLQPGNLLDLDIHPENGVDLVVHGNRIAKGELLQIGEKLGVRILEK